MKKVVFSMLIIFFIACQKEKTLSDYDKNDFIQVQGIVFESKEENKFLGESTWNVSYVFKLKGRQYKGEQNSFTEPMSVGQTLIILTNKMNPEINFFKEIGVLPY